MKKMHNVHSAQMDDTYLYLRVSKNAVFGLNFLPGFWTCQYGL